ncbi:Os07g0482300 [Oryza sativa Japonica Group]|uniref:Os07g0482300 protein n=1 Tax=Oryza sativa subsp. japonica TaxID=39947 RepID=A0A0P0X6C5_ORYSJ|nr:Os07g0482300 [Oryza sativa Japonica Group]
MRDLPEGSYSPPSEMPKDGAGMTGRWRLGQVDAGSEGRERQQCGEVSRPGYRRVATAPLRCHRRESLSGTAVGPLAHRGKLWMEQIEGGSG